MFRASKSAIAAVEKAGGSVKILAPAKEVDAEPKGKNKRMALEAAKGGDKPKGGKPKEAAGSGRRRAKAGRVIGRAERPVPPLKFAMQCLSRAF